MGRWGGGGGGGGEFVADLHIHGAHVLTSLAKTFTLGSLYYSWLLRSRRIRDFVVATRVTSLALAALIIVRIDLKLPMNYPPAGSAGLFRNFREAARFIRLDYVYW
jgi:hypothetical protein